MNTIRHWIAEHWLDIAAAILVFWYLINQKEGVTINLNSCISDPPTISQTHKI